MASDVNQLLTQEVKNKNRITEQVIQEIELQTAKNIVGHHSKLQANKTKTEIIHNSNLKMCHTKMSHKIKIKSETKSNDINTKEDVSSNRNINVALKPSH